MAPLNMVKLVKGAEQLVWKRVPICKTAKENESVFICKHVVQTGFSVTVVGVIRGQFL